MDNQTILIIMCTGILGVGLIYAYLSFWINGRIQSL